MVKANTRMLGNENFLRGPRWLVIIGVLSTLAWAGTRLHFEDINDILEAILILGGFWSVYRYGNGIGRSPLFWLLWIALGIQLASWGLSQLTHPEWAEDHPHLGRLARPLLFLLIAWWLGGNINRTLVFWAIAACSVLASPWLSGGGTSELMLALKGIRIDFDLRNAQHTGLFFGTVLLGLLCLRQRFLLPNRYRWLLRLTWAASVLFTGFVIVATQTRGIWLGLVLAAIVLLIIDLLHVIRARNWRLLAVPLSLATVVVVLSASYGGDIIGKRLQAERETVQAIFSGNVDKVPYSSIGIRFHTWRAAWDFFTERPVLGWGGNGRSLAIEHTEWLPPEIRTGFGHLHNSYLELLVNYGLVGLLFYAALLLCLLRASQAAVASGAMPRDFHAFFLTFLAFWSVINCFESYFLFWTGVFTFSVVCAGIVTLTWVPGSASEKRATSFRASPTSVP